MHAIAIPIALALGALSAAGCASAGTPQQLVEARTAYKNAAAGQAGLLAPTHLESARRALQRAEDAFDRSPEAEETIDLAYICQRLSQIAEAQAAVVLAQKEKNEAQRALHLAQERKANQTEKKLEETQEELARVEGDKQAEAKKDAQLQVEETKLDDARKDLERERQARKDAVRMAHEAREALERFAEVKEEARGMVVTIPGSVLFTSGSASLISSAGERLDTLVDALRQLKDRRVVIEGHTDSTGTPAGNRILSENRALSVKDYLVRHGVPGDRISTRGMGSDSPVSDNGTPEGRAQNRRVEIVLERVTS